jgi:RNA polymerase sigma-70 factor, ECF subfamily
MEPDSKITGALLDAVRNADAAALNQVLDSHRSQLRRMVELRMDRLLRRRVDASDVLQETEAEALRRLPKYLEGPTMPFGLWMRQLAYEQLLMMRRRHLDAKVRAMGRELALPDNTSFSLAKMLMGGGPTPSQDMAVKERAQRVREGVARLPELDREILLMRNFEGLTNQEAAQVLKIDSVAASKRYGRALLRLQRILQEGGMTESQL